MLGIVAKALVPSRKFAAGLATLALVAAGLVFQAGIDTPGAWAAVSTSGLVMNIDASNPSSYSGSGTAMTDTSGNAHNGTLTGAVAYNSSTQMLDFTGTTYSTGYVGLAGNFSDFSNGITVEFEGNMGAVNNWEAVLSLSFGNDSVLSNIDNTIQIGRKGDSANSAQIFYENRRNGSTQGRCIGPSDSQLATTARWAVTVAAAGGCQWYRNGIAVTTSADSSTAAASLLPPTNTTRTYAAIGRSAFQGDPALTGSVRYVRIYNRALSAAEISSNTTSTVTYDSNGGSGSMSAQSSSASASITSNSGGIGRSGYTFTGWNSQPNGSGTAYANAATYSFTADLTLYAQWTLNAPSATTAPTVAGTATAGQTLTATAGTYVSGTTPTVVSKWQRSADNSTWTDISGATAATYTLATVDAGNYVRYAQTVTNAAGSITSNSTATAMVLSSNSQTSGSGGSNAVTDLVSAVPNDSNVYNVSIVSSNLATGKLKWSSVPTGLTGIRGADPGSTGYLSSDGTNGWATSGFPTIHFRGTGTDIRTALGTLGYTSTTVGTDALKIYVNTGSTTVTNVTNYIPIYDNGKLTFHYYTFQTQTAQSSTSTQTTLQATTTLDGVSSPNKWYLMTPRYWIEDDRGWQLTNISSRYSAQTFLGGYADAGSNVFYYPAGTDGWASRTDYYNSSTLSALNSMYSGWYSTSWFDNSLNVLRETHYICGGTCTTTQVGNFGWDDYSNASNLVGQYVAETYSTTPIAMATTASAAQTVRTVTAPGAPTALTATANSKTSVTLGWTAPASSGTDALTDYSIQYSTDQTNWTSFSHTASTAVSATITGLTAGSNYWFRVAAISSITGAYVGPISSIQADTSSATTLTGYSIPSTTTGTIRVLIVSSNTAGKLWFGSTTNIDGGIRGTANYPDSSGYTPLYGYNPATINSAGQMVGLVDTSAADINAALASLKYSSPSASTDTIKMYVSNGTEYVPVWNSSTSQVEFRYFGYVSGSWTWANAKTAAVATRSIDGASATSFLAAPSTRYEDLYGKSLVGTNSTWLGGKETTGAANSTPTGMTWYWQTGPTGVNGVKFWNGNGSGSMPAGITYQNWGASSATSLLEPGGDANDDCLGYYNAGSGYSYSTSPTSGVAWNDYNCATTQNYLWEVNSTTGPLGSNSSNPAASNYAPSVASQTISVVSPAAAPTNLKAVSTVAGQVDLTWTAPVASGITSYSVQYSSDGVNWTESRASASTATTQSLTGLNSGTYYQIRVAAIVPTGTGYFTTTYFTPNGASRANTVAGVATAVSGMAVDSSLNSRYVRVLLRATNPSATINVTSYANLTGIRGTSNYTTTVGNAALGAAGQMIGFVGTGSQVNTALATLQYTGPGAATTDAVSMWVSAGTNLLPPREFLPIVNAAGQVEFHYFGLWTGTSLTWQSAMNAAPTESTQINGVTVSGKYLATVDTADQQLFASSYVTASNYPWLAAGDYTAVNSSNPDKSWYWMGPDISGGSSPGLKQFYSGDFNNGAAASVNSSYIAWAASSSAQSEPNGGVTENCMNISNSAYSSTLSGIVAASSTGGYNWNDNSCTALSGSYLWEYFANAPVGSSTLGDNYTGTAAKAINVQNAAEAVSDLAATAASTTAVALTWSAPTVNAPTGITGYTIEKSADSGTTWSTVTRTESASSAYEVVTGLTANTAYQFRVKAIGSNWTGVVSAATLVTTRSSATSITVVTSGGGTAGTDFTTVNGMIAPKSGVTVSVNESDVEAALATNGSVYLLADTVTVSSPITWSSNALLKLGITTASRVAINGDISGSGATASFNIAPAACTYSAAGTYTGCYSLDVKSGANITLSGATPSLKIGGVSYAVINTASALKTWGATTGNESKPFALGANVDLSADTFTRSNVSSAPMGFNSTSYQAFSGVMDGLGNSVQNLNIVATAYESGFFWFINGGTVRNTGFTSVNLSVNPYSTSGTVSLGAVAGRINAGTSTIDQVWVTGAFSGGTNTLTSFAAGGLVGFAVAGTLNVTRSWSSASMNFSALTTQIMGVGGLLGGTSDSLGGGNAAGANVYMNESYTTGPINVKSGTSWNGVGGIMGLNWTSNLSTAVLSDVAAWGTLTATTNQGGIIGLSGPGGSTSNTKVIGVTSYATCTNAGAGAFAAGSSCTANSKPGAALTGMSATAWGSSTGTSLVNLAAPVIPLYVVPVMNTANTTNYTGSSFAAISYKVVDGVGNDVTATLGTTGYPTISGTPSWDTVSSSTAVGSYSVKYTSGLSFTGTAASNYSLNPLGSATTIVLTYASVSSPPTGVTVTGSGQTTAVVGWTAPASLGTGGATGYRVWYSTNSNMSSASSIDTSSSHPYALLTGLTSNTTYYVKVQALGSAWVSDLSAVANGATKSAATTLTVVATGGGAAGTNFVTAGGAVAPITGSTSASINASDLQTLLAANDVILAADTVTISGAVTWSANTKLTLANSTSSTVAINADLTATGTSAGLVVAASESNYSIDTKSGTNVVLSGSSATLTIGGGGFTLLHSQADINALTSANAGFWYALAQPITMSTGYSAAPLNFAYTGHFDGLGNTVSNMTISPTATGDYGFFARLGGATVRNIGFLNLNIATSTASINLRAGALAGDGSSAGTNTISQVWATGFINQTATSGSEQVGGLIGGATAGTLNMSKVWSSVAVTTYGASVGSGGIIGANVASWGGSVGGNVLTISESYSTGNILRVGPSGLSWYGNGGIIGVAYGSSTSISNSFSWGNINSTGTQAGTSTGGIVGVGGGAGVTTVTNAYTTNSICAPGSTVTNCTTSATAGSAVSGFSTGTWSTTNGASLTNLPAPTKNLYVQVVAPTDGSFGTMSYQIVDSTGTVQTLSSLGLSLSNTPVYTIDGSTVKGTYNVNYVSGLTLGGSNAGVYALSAWINTTSVTISKYNQTVTWAPSTAITFAGGTATPSATPSSTATPTTTFSYAVSNPGTTGCAVNASTGALSYSAAGTCAVTVTGAASGDYVAGSATVSFVIAAPTASVTIVASGGGVQGTDYTVANGQLYVGPGGSASVNAADIATALASGSLVIAAQAVTINAPISWSANSVLTLGVGTASTVNINSNVTASGTTAGLNVAASSYGLATKSGAAVSLSGASSTLKIGGNSYTLIRSAADFANVTATSGTYWALSQPVTFSSTLTASPVNLTFTGTFDGLGNTVSGLNFSGVATSNYLALFKMSNGATFKNVGVTGLSNTVTSASSSSEYAFGALVGAAQTGTTTMTQVWSTGLIQPSTTTAFLSAAAGGLAGLSNQGATLSISKSWSSVSTNTASNTISNQAFGGLIGGDFNVFGQLPTAGGGSEVMSEVYATGTITGPAFTWAGLGGLIGLHWSTGTATITDGFSWSAVSSASSSLFGGVLGNSSGGALTLTNTYTTRGYCYYNVTSYTGCIKGVTAGQTSGVSGANWGSTNGSSLVNLPAPTTPLYVKPKFSGSTGSTLDLGYDVVDGTGTAASPSNVTVGGTAAYLPASMPVSGTAYNVTYGSGLSLSGTAAGLYSLGAWPIALSVTITRNVSTLTWSPTSTFIRTDTGVTLAAPTTNSNATAAYTVSGTGNTASCSITSGRVLTFSATGSCTVVLSYPSTATYTAISTSVAITVNDAPPAAPTNLRVTAGGATGQLAVAWDGSVTTATGGTIASYNLDTSTDGSTWTNVSTGLTGTSSTLTGLTNGTALYVRVQAVNTAAVVGAYVTSGSATAPYWKPINSAVPTLSGSPVGGLTMTVNSDGTWSNNGNTITSTTYQWQSSSDGSTWTNISGATASSYVPTSGQVGLVLHAIVTKTNSAGSTTATTAASTAVQSGLAVAATLGSIVRGNAQITVNWTAPSTLNGGTISAYKVQYSTNGTTWTTAASNISAAATSYTISSGVTNGTAYYVQVLATTAAGDGSAATSSSTTTPATVPSNAGGANLPAITGTVAVGVQLSASTGTWVTGGDAVTYSYQWQSAATANGTYVAISGATASTYTPVTVDAGAYIEVVVTATNTVGGTSATSAATTVVQTGLAAVPTALGSVASNGQLVLSWTAPTTLNGGTITDYSVQYKKSTDSGWTTVNVGSTTASKTITGLTNATAYDWSVAAVTAAGTGAAASYTAALASTPFTTPTNTAVPTIASPAVSVANTLTAGTWTDNGRTSTLTYQWEISTDGSTWSNISGATSSSYTPVSGDSGKYLRVKEIATNLAGSVNAWSASAVVRTGLASAPQSLAATRANASLAVTWAAPTSLNGGTINAYKIQYSTDGSTWSTASSSVSASATSFTITSLTNGTGYYVRAIATTAAGDGAAATTGTTSTPSTTATNTAVPVVSGTAAVARVLSSTTGSWTTGGDALTYSYQWQTSTASTGPWSSVSGATASTYTPVTADSGLFIRTVVTATNAAGSVSANSAGNSIVVSGLGDAVTNLVGDGTSLDGQLQVNWVAPANTNGGIISDYNVYYRQTGDTAWIAVTRTASTTASQLITGLTNGTRYDLRVDPVTGAGVGATATLINNYFDIPYIAAVNLTLPVVSGTNAVGNTLSTTDGTWNYWNRPGGNAWYQWQYSADGSTGWTNISGAVNATYTVAAAYSGKYLRVDVAGHVGVAAGTDVYASVSGSVQTGLASAPTSFAVSNGVTQQLAVSWAAPATLNGGTVSAYVVQYRVGTSGSWTTASSSVAANATNYTITGLTNGTGYTVQVLAVTAAGNGATAALASTIAPATAPSNSGGVNMPSISGTIAAGRVLTAANGTWAANGDAISGYSYQWQSATTAGGSYSNISGATASTYTPTASDVGNYLKVVVTATNSVGSTSATSPAVTAVTSGLANAPTSLTSTASNGQLALSWTAPTTLNGGVISDYSVSYKKSTDSTWTTVPVGSATASKTITGLTNATAYDWSVAAVTGAGTGAVASFTAALASTPFTTPSNTVTPTISGTVAAARTLTTTDGTWSDNGRTISGYSYQWQSATTAGGTYSNIASATASSYTPTASDVGNFIKVVVSATNAAGSTAVNSAATAVVASGLADAVALGSTTRADGQVTLTWSGPAATNGGVISSYTVLKRAGTTGAFTQVTNSVSAAATSYTVTGLTNGTGYTFQVWANTAAGAGAEAHTASMTVPATVPNNSAVPTISGTPAAGRALTSTDGTWAANGDSITATTYQWQSASTAGGSYSNISGATSSSYTPVTADVGSFLKLVVTATNAMGSTSAASAATAVVDTGLADAPTSPTAVFATTPQMQITVSWTAPTGLNGASAITGYQVSSSTSATGTFTTVSAAISANSSSLVVTGLTAGTTYYFTVAAITAAGTGAYTAATSGVLFGGAPANTTAPTASGSLGEGETLSVTDGSWNNNGVAISGISYQWQRSADGSTGWADISGATYSSYTLTHDDVDQYLRVIVEATNAIGSTDVTVTAGQIGSAIATAPRNLTAADGNGQIALSWVAPSNTHGGIIRSYTVQINDGTGWADALTGLADTATSATITGLTNAHAYDVRVRALTTLDGINATLTARMPYTVPTNTALPSVTGELGVGETLTAADGTWVANGRAISSTTYQWAVSSDNGQTWSNLSGETASTLVVPTGADGRLFAVTVSRTNAAGTVSATSLATGASLSGVADAPTGLALDRNASGQLTATWTAPANVNGGIIRDYLVEYRTGSGSWTTVTRSASTTTSQLIGSLTNGTSYDVRVSTITTATGSATATVTGIPAAAPVNTVVPAISGTIAVGYTLSSTLGTWTTNDAGALGSSYQWEESTDGSTGWSSISGSTESTTLVPGSVGSYLRLKLTRSNSLNSTVAYSNVLGPITTGLANAPTGVTVTPGDNQFTVSWNAITGSDLNGGINATYQLQYSTDNSTWSTVQTSSTTSKVVTSYTQGGAVNVSNGSTYYVRVSGYNTVNTGGTYSSGVSVVPFGAPISTGLPSVSGAEARGYLLTSTAGSWSGNGRSVTGTATQWQRSTDSGATWTDISSAVYPSYTLGSSDVGNLVRCAVTATNAGSLSTTEYSTATGVIGSAAANAPAGLSVAPGDEQLTVSWTAPTQLAGGTIVDYEVHISTDNSSWSTVTRSASTVTSQTITGLTNGTTYWVSVAAVTSVTGVAVTSSSATVPYGHPINSAVPSISGSLHIGDTVTAAPGTWASNGRNISSVEYQWQTSTDAGTSWIDISGATSASWVPSGVLGQPLRVVVTETNLAGTTSAVSAASSNVSYGTPAAPTAISFTPGDLSATVNWTAPTWLADGVISDYTVEINDGTGWTTVTRSASAATSQAITGLTLGTSYQVRVRTDTGISSAWATSSNYVAIGKPGSQAAPAVSGMTLAGQTLSVSNGLWDANGSPVTGYQYQWQTSTDGSAWSNVSGATAATVTATAGHYYRALVTATNAAGSTQVTSGQSLWVVSVVPGAPTPLVVTPRDQSLDVSWTTPAVLGGGTVSDYLVEYSTDGSTWNSVSRSASATTSQTITGLTNGADYYVRVKAITSVPGNWALSATTTRPFGAPISTGSLALISGTTRYAATLSSSAGSWNYNGSLSAGIAYQWQVSTDSGTSWTDIAGATTSSYVVGPYVGDLIRVKVTATNIAGQSTSAFSTPTSAIVAANPDAPASLTVTPGDQQIALSWTAPVSLGGSALASYVVQYSADMSTWYTVTRSSATATNETITGLTNGADYFVRVRAMTQATGAWRNGTGTYVPYGLPINTAAPIVSGTVQFDEVLSATDGSWNDNGSTASLAYQWQSNSGSGWTNIAGATASTYTVGLFVGQTVRAVVTATNAAGSVSANSSATSTVIAAPAGAVTGLTVTPNDQSLNVSWTAPNYVGGHAITDYAVDYSTDGSSWTAVSRTASATPTQTITGLSNGTGYFVRVRALNTVTGHAAISSGAVIPRGLPINTAVPVLTGTAQFDQVLTATTGSWNANGSSVTLATQWQSNNGSGWTNISGATASTYTVGLVVGQSVRAVVTATNAAGAVSANSTASATVIAAPAGAVTGLTVTPADQSLNVSWTAPNYIGGHAITDYAVEFSTDGSSWTAVSRSASTTTSQTITGLTNGTGYQVRVRTLNGVTGQPAIDATGVIPRGLPIATATPGVTMHPNSPSAPQVGRAITANQGLWNVNGSSISSVSYQWQVSSGSSWSNIAGATTASYTPTANVGSQLRVVVTATNVAGATDSASVATAAIIPAAASAPLGLTVIEQDQALAVSWQLPTSTGGAPVVDYEVQTSPDADSWTTVQRTSSAATSQAITGLTNAVDVYVRVRALNGVNGAWAFISQPATPRGLPINTALPSMVGTEHFGAVLSADNGTWDGNGADISATTYQWQSSTDGTSWANIPGASTANYTIGLYVGSALRVQVTSSNEAGSTTATSAPTGVITAIPAATPVLTSQSIGNGQFTVGWTPPVHTGGIDLVGYSLQYSTDQSTWTTVTTGPTVTSTTVTGLVNGTGYFARVRAQTDLDGEWSPIAGPFTPVAPPVAAVASRAAVIAPQAVDTGALLARVMPVLNSAASISSLTGDPTVTVTSDGRIELKPNQSVALVNGEPVQAAVTVSNTGVTVQTGTVSVSMQFGTTSNNTGQSEITAGASANLSGGGFAATAPVVSWIQSTPTQLKSSHADSNGVVSDQLTIPASIQAGEHTIQINGVDAKGQIISIIYGVKVLAADPQLMARSGHFGEPGAMAGALHALWLFGIAILLLLVAAWVVRRQVRR